MKFPINRKLAVGALAAGLALGGTGVAVASSGDTAEDTKKASGAESNMEESDPSYTGSVKAPADTESDGAEGEDSEASEAAESEALQSLATITAEQAKAAALAAVDGEAGEVELGNENGYVVYEVEVTTADNQSVEVKVDAGDGAVLAQEAEDENEADEADEAATTG